MSLDTMPESDNHYGSSAYRQFEPISKRLKVEAGSNKPARVRNKKGVVGVAATNGGIAGNQTDRKSKWVRISPQGKVTHPLTQGTDATTSVCEESYENADTLYDNGIIDYEEYSEIYDTINSNIDEDNGAVIQSY